MNYLQTLTQLISKYLMVLIIGFSCMAYIVPSYFTWAVAYTPFLLGIAMFGMGLTIKFENLCNIFRHPKDICIGVLAQYTIMPLLAWGICHIFTLPPDIAIGVILVGCCPGGTASNSHINTLTSISPIFSMIAIILLIAAIIAVNRDKLLVSGLLTLIIVGIHNVLGLLLGLIVGKTLKLKYDKTTALAIEVGMQNSGLAVTLAATNFALNPLATLVGAIFSVWHNISGAIFASIRRNKISI